KSIGPTFTQLASQYAHVVFLKVDVAKNRRIEQRYNIDQVPTFILAARRFGLASAVPSGVTSVAPGPGVAAAVPKVTSAIPVEADIAKAQGNAAFAVGDYTTAAAHYSRAVELAPKWAVPRANRALAYMKLIGEEETEGDLRTGMPKAQSNQLRPRAMEDAYMATLLDERWGKGWVRLAQVMLMEAEVEEAEKREEGIRKMLGGAQAALYNAVGLSEGRVLKGE
ncbi:thioredoxin-domain-containing protein, partial [Schizophyllum commune]